jgi:hypothetical protein
MDQEQQDIQYEAPFVEDLETAEGPSTVAAGTKQISGPV